MSITYLPPAGDRLAHVNNLDEAYVLVQQAEHGLRARLQTARELVEDVRSDMPRNGTLYDRADAAVHDIQHIERGEDLGTWCTAARHDIEELQRGLR